MCYNLIGDFWVASARNNLENHGEEPLEVGGLVTHLTLVQSL